MKHKALYKEYLRSEMSESMLIEKLDILQNKESKTGVIYTPYSIVQEMIAIAKPTKDMFIIEPSCGHGIFLIGLLDYMRTQYQWSGVELYQWFCSHVTALELNQNTINEVKEIIIVYFLKHFKMTTTSTHYKNIICHDSLTYTHSRKYQLCIGNPPYIRAKHLTSEYLSFLKHTFSSCKKGVIDIYYAFIEKYQSIADNVVFITPNSFLTSNTGKTLRTLIEPTLTLLIDFKDKKIFSGVGTYTCIFHINAHCHSTQMQYGNELTQLKITDKSTLFNKASTFINKEYKVYSGITTLCDSVYLVKKVLDKYFAHIDSVAYEIESEMIVPYLKLTKIKDNQIAQYDYMIYPYKNKEIITEQELKEKYPLTYSYLLISKEKLLQRDKGKTEKYDSWYAYGRKQGLHTITAKQVVIVPLMIGGNCVPQLINITDVISAYPVFVFTSGFIIPYDELHIDICNRILSHSFRQYAELNGKAWPGKNEAYYSLTTKQIKEFMSI